MSLGACSGPVRVRDEFAIMAYKNIVDYRQYHATYNRLHREKRYRTETVFRNRDWTKLSLAWVAGVFEGEGCFTTSKYRNSRTFVARISMTDEDVVRKIHAVTQMGNILIKRPEQAHHKVQFSWTVSGFEGFQAVVAALWPWLGNRRKSRAKEILILAQDYFATPQSNGRPRTRFRRRRQTMGRKWS